MTDLKDVASTHFIVTLLALSKTDLVEAIVPITRQAFATTPADDRLRQALLKEWRIHGIASSIVAELEKLVGDFPAFGSGLIIALAKVPGEGW